MRILYLFVLASLGCKLITGRWPWDFLRPVPTRQQALFRPAAGSDVFLPDVSGRIERDDQVEAVWFDAESAFTRT